MFLKIMPKLLLKTVICDYNFNFKLKTVLNNYGFNLKKFKTIFNNYGFNLKKIKTIVINYGFDEDTLVWTFFFKNVLHWYFWTKLPICKEFKIFLIR